MKKFIKKIETNSLYGLMALGYDFDELTVDEMFNDFIELDTTSLTKTEPTEYDLIIEGDNNGNI